MFKLLFIEPWDFVTENGSRHSNIDIRKGNKNNWLLTFDSPVKYKNANTKYLLGRPEKKHCSVNLLDELFDKIIFELIFVADLNDTNFINFDIDNHRGDFITAELMHELKI